MKTPVPKCSQCGAVMRRVGEWLFCLLCDCPAGTLAAMKAVGPPVVPGPDGAQNPEPGE